MTTIHDVKIIELPKFEDPRGNLSFIEEENQIPFKIKRTYWIYDVPGGQVRGGHAFIKQQELIVALSGSFDVLIKDGKQSSRYSLKRSYYGLLIPNGLWRQMDEFSTNSLGMVLSSTSYEEKDYLYNYSEFLKYKQL